MPPPKSPNTTTNRRHAYKSSASSRPENWSTQARLSETTQTPVLTPTSPRRPSHFTTTAYGSTRSRAPSTSRSPLSSQSPLTAQSPLTSQVPSTSQQQSSHLRVQSAASSSAQSVRLRDSFSSILDDPFFQDYEPLVLQPLDGGYSDLPEEFSPTTASNQQGDEQKSTQVWPPPRRESLTIGPSQYWNNAPVPVLVPKQSSNMETYNIAFIGAAGVGKSSFVQRVLGLSRPPISNASSVRMVVDNVTHMITLLELDLEYFELSPSQPIQWPKQINGHIVPRVDAALVLYDVMNQESIQELPQTLAALTNSGLPSILVANKCERPKSNWQVDPEAMAKHKYFEACIGAYQVSTETPDVARSCLQAILRAAVFHRREENGETVARRRAQSNLEAQEAATSRPLNDQYGHSRASSDLSLLRGFGSSATNERPPSKSPNLGQQPSDPDSQNQQSYNSMLRSSSGIRVDKPGNDFHDGNESEGDSAFMYSDDIPILQRNDDGMDRSAKLPGISFDELVDRLLAPKISKADNNFSDVFLCLYRKFAAPGELFSAILARLDCVRDDKAAHYLSRTATQLRMTEVAAKWVSLYPGDFARPATRRNLEEFIKHLSTEPIFSIAAQHMRRNLQFHVIEDDDTGWANADGDRIASQILQRDSELAAGVSALQFDEDSSGRPSSCSGASTSSGHIQFQSYEHYEREAALLEPTDQLPMNKSRYHIFMDIPDDDVADELTRIDWVMFSSIRIRDFVRHVSLSAQQKEKCKSLRNVNRMIAHFNHVAQWVANLILLRDKAKHRAQMLEKFMNIALKLRQLNNYNGLAAVLAGINGTAIHRLAQTRALVPPEVQKRFARLVILMGTQKSHFAYRLAWENSPLPRIPFIPLHRRDLVSAEEGSKTFVGPKNDRVNWKKFEVLGEVLLPIMKSQGTAYPNLSKNDAVRELILGCRMPTDDEEIYQRSVQVENGNTTEPSRKKSFPWFASK